MGPDTHMLPYIEDCPLPHTERRTSMMGIDGTWQVRMELATAHHTDPEVGTVEKNPTWLLPLFCFSELPGQAGKCL